MSGSRYIIGADVLGARPTASADQAVVIRIRDPGKLIHSKSDAGGALFNVVPQALTDMAYDKMAEEMKTKLAENGVDADVRVESAPGGPAPSSEIGIGAVIGAAGMGALWLFSSLFRRRK